MKTDSHDAPQHRLADLRDWLMDRIDGSIETRGEDGLVSDFIRQIDAQDAELADLKQRLLPQFAGRTQRAEHERDALLEQLIAARSATAATQDAQAIVASCCAAFDCRPSELLGMILGLKGTAPPVEEEAIGHARYEYVRTLSPRQFAALYDEALHGDRFDVLVDRYRDAREPAPTGCGAIFKESEGWSCDCERAHPAPCKANAPPTTKEQP